MFSKIKHWFDGKGKKTVALLATAALLCSFTGCTGNEASNSIPDSVTSALQSTPDAESKDSLSSEVNSDNTSSSEAQNEHSSGQSEFDFDEAVKSIMLFGSKISLPCTIADFGNDFTLNNDNIILSGHREKSVCVGLCYRGKEIGSVHLENCDVDEKLDDKKIYLLTLGFPSDYGYPNDEIRDMTFERDNHYSGIIEFELEGISFLTSKKDITERLGTPHHNYEGTNFEGKVNLLDMTYTFDEKQMTFYFADERIYMILICV